MGKQPGPSDFGWIEKRRDSSLLNRTAVLGYEPSAS